MDTYQVLGIVAMTILGSCLAHDFPTNMVREKRQLTHQCPGTAVIYYQDVNNCHAYFQCSENQPIRFVCDGNMMYNPSTQTCQHMSTAPNGCGGNSGGSGGSNGVPRGTYNCDQPNGRFQDTSNCRRYYSCSNNIARLVDCTGGRLFDPTVRRCANVQHPAGCTLPTGNSAYTGNVHGLSGTVGTMTGDNFECTQRYAVYQDPSNCGSFWQCQDWVATRMQCSQDWLFFPHSYSGVGGTCQQPSPSHRPVNCAMPNSYQW